MQRKENVTLSTASQRAKGRVRGVYMGHAILQDTASSYLKDWVRQKTAQFLPGVRAH